MPSMRAMSARTSRLCPRSKKVTSSLTTMRRSTIAPASLLAAVSRRIASPSARRSIAASSCAHPASSEGMPLVWCQHCAIRSHVGHVTI